MGPQGTTHSGRQQRGRVELLKGRPVDRPAVCFYEINGLDQDPSDADSFNLYSDPTGKRFTRTTIRAGTQELRADDRNGGRLVMTTTTSSVLSVDLSSAFRSITGRR